MKKFLAIVGMLGLMSFNASAVLAVVDPLAPTITSVTPQTGPTAGGTTITITGTNLASSTVTIGGVSTTGTVVAEDNLSLTTVTVENGLSTEDIVVTTPHGSALLEGGFTFTNSTSTGTTTPPVTGTSTATSTHTLTYNVFVNGTLTGSSTQIVADGGAGTAVTVNADQWFQFSNWSDGSTANPRTDTNVTSDITVSANFISSSSTQPCNGSTFDTLATGTVNGQGGWHVIGDFDQEVVPNTYGFATFGCKALRFSDATTSPFIYNQTFSYTADNEAGETDAISGDSPVGTRQNHFEAQFDLASVTHNEQAGMHMSASLDRGDGTRMGAVSFLDSTNGVNMYFDDVNGTSTPVSFDNVLIANDLNRTVPHTIKLVADFVDGPSNDTIKVYVDGFLVHTGPTWENYYRYDADVFGGPTPDNSRTVNSLSFSENGSANPGNKWNGFLIDNVVLATSVIPDTAPDTTAPVITLNGSSTMEVIQNGTFTDPGATAHDDFDGFVAVVATGTVDTGVLGGYTITYTASDTMHNTASTTRTVNVVASSPATSTPTGTSTAPIITLNGSSTVMILQNTTFNDSGATAVDSNGNSLEVMATGTVNTATLGDYVITYSATDSNNNTATTTRTVQVVASISTTTGGGGGGGSSSGGGFFVSGFTSGPTGSVITSTPVTVTSTGSNITISGITTPTGQVLGAVTFNFTRNLKLGMTGDDVLQLQTLLKAGGFLILDIPTKYFGGKTFAALKKWQKKNGIPDTGFFGPLSRAFVIK
jgi:hypothetical protein